MPKKSIISTPIKEAIVRACLSGKKQNIVATDFGVNQSVVSRVLKASFLIFCIVKMVFKLHRLNQDLHRRPKSGRRPKTSDRQQRQLVRLVKIDPNKTASDVRKHSVDVLGVQISHSTAQRILRRHKLNARRPARKPLLKKCHRMVRLHFARVHRHWTVADWRRVIWSDERKFNLYNSDGAIYI